MERTLCLIKPDAVSMGFTDAIICNLEEKGFFICQQKETTIDRRKAVEFFTEVESEEKFDAIITNVTSGTYIEYLYLISLVALELAKVNAVNHLKNLLGPADPKVAKQIAPRSLRARFGTDEINNAVYGSTSLTSATQEIAFFFPRPPLRELPAKAYLAATILPAISQALVNLCRDRPADPHSWISSWLNVNKPSSAIGADPYPEPVLPGHVLKSDEFELIHREKIFGPRFHPKIWNFRKAEGPAPVYGMGQGHLEGIKAVINHLLKSGFNKVMCLNMREEPMVFVNGEPISFRLENQLNENIDYFYGISAFDLERIEIRLKTDIYETSKERENKITIYYQNSKMENNPKEIDIRPHCIKTLRQFYDYFSEKSDRITYNRIPITDEIGPDDTDFDALVELLKHNEKTTAVLCNCQMGQGRTTTAMVIASLIWRARNGLWTVTDPIEPNFNEPDHKNGEFKCVMSLLKDHPLGIPMKQLIDEICDSCGKLQNLRTTINDAIEAAKKSQVEDEISSNYAFYIRRAHNYLRRYYTLIVFSIYVRENVGDNYTISFSQWMRNHWTFRKIMHYISLD